MKAKETKKVVRVLYHLIIIIATIFYIFFLMKTLFLERMVRGYLSGYDYNLIPFKTIKTYLGNYDHYNFNTWFNNLFGNILLFIPFGFITPYTFVRFRRFFPFLIFVVSFVAIIEVTQIALHLGSFDIDDILLNSLGGVIGYSVFSLWNKLLLRILNHRDKDKITR